MKAASVYRTVVTSSSAFLTVRCVPVILAFLAFGIGPCFGQEQLDTISMQKLFSGYAFYQNGERLNTNQLSDVLMSHPEAYEKYKDANSLGLAAGVLSYAGGFLIGWPIGTTLGGGEANWNLALIGAGLFTVSLPLSNGSNKRTLQAIDIFNNQPLPSSPSNTKPNRLNVSIQGNGAGFVLHF